MKTKKCTICNEIKPLTDFYYHKTREIYVSRCTKCSSKYTLEYQRNGYRKTEGWVFYQRAYDLKRRDKECSMSVKELKVYLNELWTSQNGKCGYTGLDMALTGYHTNNTNYAMTVDRIDADKGYLKGNMILCLAIINKIKQNLTINELIQWVSLIKKDG